MGKHDVKKILSLIRSEDKLRMDRIDGNGYINKKGVLFRSNRQNQFDEVANLTWNDWLSTVVFLLLGREPTDIELQELKNFIHSLEDEERKTE